MESQDLPEIHFVEPDLAGQAAGIGALADPMRRSIYEFVSTQEDAVGREAVAKHQGIPLHTARSQLDRLVKDGLLEVEFRRLSGKSGPGAGRPSKLYRRSAQEFAISLPARNYDLVGHILATAVEDANRDGVPAAQTMDGVSYEEGRRFAAAIEVGEGDELDTLAQALTMLGFEPMREGATLSLRNCPFDTLAKQHTELVCGLNLSFVRGVCDQLDASRCEPVLEPEPGLCCVRIRLT